jgi:hypothetical protein
VAENKGEKVVDQNQGINGIGPAVTERQDLHGSVNLKPSPYKKREYLLFTLGRGIFLCGAVICTCLLQLSLNWI